MIIDVFRRVLIITKSSYWLLHVSLPVCPSVWTTLFPLDGFSWNLIFDFFFRKSVKQIEVSLKSDKNNRYFTWRSLYIFIIYRSVLLRMRIVLDEIVQNRYTHFLLNKFFFVNFYRLWDYVKIYCRAGQATNDNITHARCVLGT